MAPSPILYPLFCMVLLTAIALFRLGYLRYVAVAHRQVDPSFYKTYQGSAEPDRVAATSRHVINLFETPVLFYAAVLLALQTGRSGALLVGLAWSYVAFRAAHSWIHLTFNAVIWRFRVFIMSWLALLSMWAVLAVELL